MREIAASDSLTGVEKQEQLAESIRGTASSFEREYTAIQREIDRLQELGAAQHSSEIDALWARKFDLLQRIEGLI